MSTTSQVREVIQAQPFRPFIVRLADGRNYQIDHPELAMLGPGNMNILFVCGDEAIHLIDVPLIVELVIPTAMVNSEAEGNGP